MKVLLKFSELTINVQMPNSSWTGKSPWNTAMDKLKEKLHIQYDISTVAGDKDVEKLFEAIVDIYQLRNLEVGSTQSTENLTKMMTQAFAIFELNAQQKRDLRININRVAKEYELEYDLAIRQAPVIPIPKLMQLAWALWYPQEKVQKGSLYKRRAGATILAICAFTGNRWIDTCRLKWEDLKLEKSNGLWFAFFKMRVSKTTFGSRRPIWCSMYETTTKRQCPIEMLVMWWRFTGQKQAGFLFPNHATHDNGDGPYNQVRTVATKLASELQLAQAPSKHTPRNTLVATMFHLGFSLDAIRRKFNWVTDSDMPHHYLSFKLDKVPSAIARTLSLTVHFNALEFQNELLNI